MLYFKIINTNNNNNNNRTILIIVVQIPLKFINK